MDTLSTTEQTPLVFDWDPLTQLNSPDAKALLDTIDNLRELNIGDISDLPQIIVVGDRSSGKSSVLEAISRVPFPVNGDLCTRFATELVFRRSTETSVTVSIQIANYAPSTADDAAPHQLLVSKTSSFDKDTLPDTFREVQEIIGIGEGGAKFFKNILRVEVASSEIYPLTLVDLPGILHNATADQDLEGNEIVHEIVDNYMRQPKSIILVVIAANNELANQVFLQEARKHDPHGNAPLESSLSQILLAPHLPTSDSISILSRVARICTSSPSVGVESLRERLRKVLLDHVRARLPNLIYDIETNLRNCQEELSQLGKPRSSPEELRSYLLGIADDFQQLARDAVEGRYSNDKFFGSINQKGAKLRARLRNLNRAFTAIMMTKGARYKIELDEPDTSEDLGNNGRDDEFPEYLQELIDEYNVPDPELKPEEELNTELQLQASHNQAKEFPGEANGELARQLFREQAAPWQDIASVHLRQTLKASKEFVEQAFVHIIGADMTTLEAILSGCVDPFFEEKEEMLQIKLRELLVPYINVYGLPLENEFRERMEKRTLLRLAGRLSERLEQRNPELFSPNPVELLSRYDIKQAVIASEESKSDEFGTRKVIDMMMTYYDMSLRTFVDNVINLAVESCLVCDIPTILTPRKVNAMSTDRMKELASESEEIQNQRLYLQNEVKILTEALRKCQRHKPRELIGTFDENYSQPGHLIHLVLDPDPHLQGSGTGASPGDGYKQPSFINSDSPSPLPSYPSFDDALSAQCRSFT
ncbi:Interferon-induced GTP-binding protein Mx [Madurella mycetomatis]|uniref:Interferon-induced GTP-binding protein Mx n=1 Tax=Madurella mycetomatis TaxID=100816 RepID=A0A175VY03_9PEZI|nr:Interferon-induced GTP-binding protein Mx [Madurella mycetomatis]